MTNNVITTLKTNKEIILKRTLIIGAAATGLIIAGALALKNKDAFKEDAFEVTVETE